MISNLEKKPYAELRAYALGYFDGRSVGTEEHVGLVVGEERHFYRTGYDAGVTDACYYDLPEHPFEFI